MIQADLQELGTIESPSPTDAKGYAVSPEQFALIERAGSKVRWRSWTTSGPAFDSFQGGGVWLGNRLVYLARLGSRRFLVEGDRSIELTGETASPLGNGRVLVSHDRQHWFAWAFEGKKIRWWRNGVKQGERFDRLPLVPIVQPRQGPPLFAGRYAGTIRLYGAPMASKTRWSRLDAVFTSADGRNVLAYGLLGDGFRLQLNEHDAAVGPLGNIQFSADGGVWMATRAGSQGNRCELLRNGEVVDAADVLPSEQALWMSVDGARWRWVLRPADDQGAVMRRDDGSEYRFAGRFMDLQLSYEDRREAVFEMVEAPEVGSAPVLRIDGQEVARNAAALPPTLCMGPAASWSILLREGDRFQVMTADGIGTAYAQVSERMPLADGSVAYVAYEARGDSGQWWGVIGEARVALDVDNVHLASLRLRDGGLEVIGTRYDAELRLLRVIKVAVAFD